MHHDPVVIAFCGPKRHGKNTAANALLPLGFIDEPFAKPVKEICAIAMAEDVLLYMSDSTKEEPSETYPEDTRRTIMQQVGTELFRGRWPDIWVRNWTRRIERCGLGRFVCTDLRFPNEAEAVKAQKNSLIIRVINPNKPEPTDVHESEIHYKTLPVDVDIVNDGTIADLHVKVMAEVLDRWEFLTFKTNKPNTRAYQ
jgi:hypothetical protein